MSLGDFIFGLLAGPVAPIVEYATGNDKGAKDALMGTITGATIAATTVATVFSFGAAAPAAGAADAAVVGADSAAIGADAAATGAEVGAGAAEAGAAGAAAGSAAADVGATAAAGAGASASEVAATTAEAGGAAAAEGGAEAATAGATEAGATAAEAGTEAAATGGEAAAEGGTEAAVTAGETGTEAAPDVISGASDIAPTATDTASTTASEAPDVISGASPIQTSPQVSVDGGMTEPTIEGPTKAIDWAKVAKTGLSTIGNTYNTYQNIQKAGQQQVQQVMPRLSITGGIGGDVGMRPLPAAPSIAGPVNTNALPSPGELRPLSDPSITNFGGEGTYGGNMYNTIFGQAPNLSQPIMPITKPVPATQLAPINTLKNVPPEIQAPPQEPLTTSDKRAKTNIRKADRSVKDFLNKVRISNA